MKDTRVVVRTNQRCRPNRQYDSYAIRVSLHRHKEKRECSRPGTRTMHCVLFFTEIKSVNVLCSGRKSAVRAQYSLAQSTALGTIYKNIWFQVAVTRQLGRIAGLALIVRRNHSMLSLLYADCWNRCWHLWKYSSCISYSLHYKPKQLLLCFSTM